jgi:proteasome lid subunit RPN8/RPN11
MNLILPRDIRSLVRAELRKAGRREIGGLLMAEQIKPNEFRVVQITVDQNAGSAIHFERRSRQHNEALADFFGKTGGDYGRFNYLGEWHSHPSFSTIPSLTDIESMQELVQEPGIEFAVLMIVRLNLQLWLSVHAELFTRIGTRSVVKIC